MRKTFLSMLFVTIVAACAATAPPAHPVQEPEHLAACLTRTGAHLYGASWCHWCHVQIKMFGADAPGVPYVDCDPEGTLELMPACVAQGFEFDSPLPTWILGDGTRVVGVHSLASLAARSGCPSP